MPYDNQGRWVPSDITEDERLLFRKGNEAKLREKLTESGLDWTDQGKYAFRTDIWGEFSEEERFDIIKLYDTWYDKGDTLSLNDEAWGLDIERGITYTDVKSWSTQERFHYLTGGDVVHVYTKDTPEEIIKKGKDKYSKMERGEIVGQVEHEGELKTLINRREYPMDWAAYTHDDLYRAAIDDVLEHDFDMFFGPGGDYNNARQVRAADKEIKSWRDHYYQEAKRLSGDYTEAERHALAEEAYKEYEDRQITQGKLHNKRYPEGDNTRGYQHNQQVMIRKYKPYQQFNEETGTMTRVDPLSGDVKSIHYHGTPELPTRMTITGDKTLEDVDAGKYFSPTFGYEQQITDSLADTPADIEKPNITIRSIGKARLPESISGWNETAERSA